LDGRAHVGRAELGEDVAVVELDHRVNYRLGVDDDVDLLGREVEKPAGFDQLQALVEHRGGVDGDLAPHAPGGVLEGVGEGGVLDLLGGGGAKGAAGGGEDQALDLAGLPA